MRRHAARISRKRMKSKNSSSGEPPWQVLGKPPIPSKRLSISESNNTHKNPREGDTEGSENCLEAVVKRSSPQILEIDDAAGRFTPKWLRFCTLILSSSRELSLILMSSRAADDTPQWILHESYIHFCAACMLFLYQRLLDPKSPPRPEVLEHRMKAYATLRKELEVNGPTDIALLAITGMIGMEVSIQCLPLRSVLNVAETIWH